jgi:hypothetical protein
VDHLHQATPVLRVRAEALHVGPHLMPASMLATRLAQ